MARKKMRNGRGGKKKKVLNKYRRRIQIDYPETIRRGKVGTRMAAAPRNWSSQKQRRKSKGRRDSGGEGGMEGETEEREGKDEIAGEQHARGKDRWRIQIVTGLDGTEEE
ncbi:hypothetical protein BO94DRAFT_234343 [Aspergillus sclerotioniger CBS 115572]|uniref:Uncharacterized protein n=1 Tax=Aspergillus sclerotioniger CBS 115572 TaxID=1450535 RepID=A0A317VHF7_9EURO|nr:hypothetical protein BO94DRAFT_234343 [Aspergillus sclerotioniger CBS 115572]PWY73796.1 hypothetical protein BO94DRAFT_234343 [Aspergillus sclerotioniger CBS 115572]